MDVPQLKLLAGLVRRLLEQHNVAVGHGQALDLIASLPGLRNWSEVNAFPDRVAACDLTSSAAVRLSRRLTTRHGVEFAPADLISKLGPSGVAAHEKPPELWPGGPKTGVYLTTSQAAIDALMVAYDEATDGAPLYAERAGDRFSGAISLGEDGLWSPGLSRVPSGTLLVVGPLELTQEEWGRNADRLQEACVRAQLDSHRVAVLINTPAPTQLHSDALLLVRSEEPNMDDLHQALRGVVSESGELTEVSPFLTAAPKPRDVRVSSSEVKLPPAVERELLAAIARTPAGIIVLGSNEWKAPRALLLESLLPLTESAGPVARILPDHRVDYDGEPPLSDHFAEVPVMPSVESAYAHGYRRMVIEKAYGASERLLEYAEEVCFIMGAFSAEAEGAFMNAISPRHLGEAAALERVIAVIGLAVFETKHGKVFVPDMYTNSGQPVPKAGSLEALIQHLNANRILRWQDGLETLLASRQVTVAQVREACPNHHTVHEYLASRSKKRAAAGA